MNSAETSNETPSKNFLKKNSEISETPLSVLRYRKADDVIRDIGGAEIVMDTIFKHVANGGSLITLCELWGCRYSDMIHWIENPGNEQIAKMYDKAQQAGLEWMRVALVEELRGLSMVDVTKAFDEQGRLRELSEIPEDTARAIAGIETYEDIDKTGVVQGQVRKVKFYDKLRAIELLGKKLAMFVSKFEFGIEEDTLEALVMRSKKVEGEVIEVKAVEVKNDGAPLQL